MGKHDYDIAICGAGPGGVGAALSAARLGLRALLIEQTGCVGGCWTSGMMGISLDMPGKGGIPLEILEALLESGNAQWVDARSYTYDIEAMKRLLEQLLTDAGVEVLLYAPISGVLREGQRIAAITVEGYESQRFTADFFVDATGHGTLGMLSGCAFDMGHPEKKALQPASLHAMVTGVPNTWASDIHNPARKKALYALLEGAGAAPSYPAPLLFQPKAGKPLWMLAINHQYEVSPESAQSVSRATLAARAEIGRAIAALQTIPGWEGLTLCATADQIGLRDGRRIRGLYTLTTDDALAGRRFPDGVVPIHQSIDVHQLSEQDTSAAHSKGKRFQPFQIPLRCLIAEGADNLLLAGRCISGEFLPHSAYRMTTSACAMGEAAGIAAARAGAGGRARDVAGEAVREEMIAQGYGL